MPHFSSQADTMSSMKKEQNQWDTDRDVHQSRTHGQESRIDFEAALAAARPRLLRFAHLQGVPGDAADDIVQETLLEAWRHLNQLRSPQGIDAWLYKICSHVCHRWSHAQSRLVARQTSLSAFSQGQSESPFLGEAEVPDPCAFDPAEELQRQDLESLLSRAMGYLSANTRTSLELCYLSDLSRSEAALRLGVTINALEVRLHRAHRQLRQVLSGELRADAEALGLRFTQDMAIGWHETREWCNLCGCYRLSGLLESQPDGRVFLRLRCPGCSPRYGDMFNGGLVSLEGFRTFRPAFKHAWKAAFAYWTHALETGEQYCVNCNRQLPLQIVRQDELDFPLPFPVNYRVILDCPLCGITGTCSVAALLNHPDILRFTQEHPRWIIGPDAAVVYAGQPSLHISLLDPANGARLIALVHRRTLQILATFPA